MTRVEGHGAGRTIRRLNPDLADDPPVAVTLLPLDPHLLVENQARQVLLRPLAEGLGLLGGIDAQQANIVLLAGSIEDGYRVTIGNADDAASQGVGVSGADQ